MCLSSPSLPKDTSAEQAQAQSDKRQAQVEQGQSAIDNAFSKFDDNYFDTYQKGYVDNYNPQVDEQFGKAQTKLRYNDARRGMLNSTSAIFNQDQLNKGYGEQRQEIAANALGATNTLKNNVQSQKSQLYAQNTAAADPSLASSQAAAAAGTIPNTPQYSVLGDLFGGLVNGAAAYQNGANKNNPYYSPNTPLPGSSLPGSSSGRVVR